MAGAQGSRRKIVIRNMIIAVLVAAVTLLVEETRFGQVKMDEAFDGLVRHEVEQAATDREWSRSDVGFAVIALTADTYNFAPGGPAWTPRRWVIAAMRQAIAGGAKAVFVDYAFPFDIPIYQVDGQTLDEQRDWTVGLAAAVSEAAARDVALLFPDPQDDGMGGTSAFIDSVRDAAARHPHVLLGSAGFMTDPLDHVVRRIETYHRDADGKLRPSLVIQAVLIHAYGLREGLKQIQALSARLSDPVALQQGFDWPLPAAKRPLHFARNEPDEECVSARLRLRLVPDKTLQRFANAVTVEGRGDGLVTPFDPLAAMPAAADGQQRFKGRVVLIGSTDPRLGDMHRASVGEVPGVYVHANSVDTLQRGLQPLPGRWWNVLAVLLFALIAGWMFALLPPMAAMKATAAVVWVVLAWTATRYFEHTGVFINIWAPMAGLVVLEGLAEFEHWWHGRKGH